MVRIINLLSCVFIFTSLNGQFSTVEIQQQLENISIQKGIDNADLSNPFITDNYTSQGFSHVYMHQSVNGIPLKDSYIAIHKKGDFVYSNENMTHNLASYSILNTINYTVEDAINAIATHKSIAQPNQIQKISDEQGKERAKYLAEDFSLSEILARTYFYKKDKTTLTLCYELQVEHIADAFLKLYYVDAATGEIIDEKDLTVSCGFGHCNHKSTPHYHKAEEPHSALMVPNSYNVFAEPLASPHDGGRTVEVEPWLANPTASPNGWHQIGTNNYQHSRGNNTDAYEDVNDSNGPTGGDAARADGGATLDFDFPWSTGTPLSMYQDAAITNVFYWANLCHDVWFNYGFDEPSGNFQEENYTGLGLGSDYVRSEVQDGSGTCNANFGTPADGGNPRMQMYVCSSRDGAFDNLVIVHEYGHGISNRLTGGPGAAGCLGNSEQMGEGWSDYFGAVMSIQAGDQGTDAVGVGTWLFGQGPNGPGIRPFPYSTDLAVNPQTYDDIKSAAIPHGVGSVWATMIWEMTWALIDVHGFDPDLYNGTGGNNIAMQLVTEGLKLQPCSPGFVDGRNAILAADQAIYGGANQCLIWEAFSKRGLGFSATQGSSSSRSDGTEAFDMPPTCFFDSEYKVNKTAAGPTNTVQYDLKIINTTGTAVNGIALSTMIPDTTTFISATNGGASTGGEVVWPTVNLGVGDSIEYNFVVEVNSDKSIGYWSFEDDVESGNNDWKVTNSGSTSWSISNSQSSSGNSSWFAPDNNTPGVATLDLDYQVGIRDSNLLEFTHFYNTEFTWDGGRVFVSTNDGESWIDLGPNFIQNGYNSTVYNSIPAFSGNSGGFITSKVDMSSYAGQGVKVRFQMDCDQIIGDVGWFVDDIKLTNLHHFVNSKLTVAFNGTTAVYPADSITFIENTSGEVNFTLTAQDVSCGGTNDGSVSLQIGNPSNYSYLWSNGATTQNIMSIPGGWYSVTVTETASGLNGVDSIRVLGGRETWITKTVDDNTVGTMRFHAFDGYCPNDTLIISPSLNGQDILIQGSSIRALGPLAIIGNGTTNNTILSQAPGETFWLRSNVIFELRDLTVKGGHPTLGTIINDGTVILNNAIIDENGGNNISFSGMGNIIIRGNSQIKE